MEFTKQELENLRWLLFQFLWELTDLIRINEDNDKNEMKSYFEGINKLYDKIFKSFE